MEKICRQKTSKLMLQHPYWSQKSKRNIDVHQSPWQQKTHQKQNQKMVRIFHPDKKILISISENRKHGREKRKTGGGWGSQFELLRFWHCYLTVSVTCNENFKAYFKIIIYLLFTVISSCSKYFYEIWKIKFQISNLKLLFFTAYATSHLKVADKWLISYKSNSYICRTFVGAFLNLKCFYHKAKWLIW